MVGEFVSLTAAHALPASCATALQVFVCVHIESLLLSFNVTRHILYLGPLALKWPANSKRCTKEKQDLPIHSIPAPCLDTCGQDSNYTFGQGKMNEGQGKVRELYLVNWLATLYLVIGSIPSFALIFLTGFEYLQ